MKPNLETSPFATDGDRAFSKMPLWHQEKVVLHMPGHISGHFFSCDDCNYLISTDTTELSLSDNLHNPQGTVLEIQNWMQELYGSGFSQILTTGSTTGIQVMLSSCLRPDSHLLLDRRCHMSAAYALSLIGCQYSFIQDFSTAISQNIASDRPESSTISPLSYLMDEEHGDLSMLSMIEHGLCTRKDISDVLITSPDYFGRCEDITRIAEIVHQHGCRLLVDEAHGAHFIFGDDNFPDTALKSGADIVVQSVHKTLPALTMASLLHVSCEAIKSKRVNPSRILSMLQIFETSSPSFVIAASLQMALRRMDKFGRAQFSIAAKRLHALRDRLSSVPGIDLISGGAVKNGDPMRIGLSFARVGISASQVAIELERRGFIVEMHSPSYVLMLFNIFNTQDDLDALLSALKDIVDGLSDSDHVDPTILAHSEAIARALYTRPPERAMHVRQAIFQSENARTHKLSESAGMISSGMLLLYPPGIPILWPGEILSEAIVTQLSYLIEHGTSIDGIVEKSIWVLDNTNSNA